MATTKAVTAIWNAQSISAGGSNTSSAVVLDDGYGAALHLKITNGATAPSTRCYIQIQTSADNSEWYDFGGRLYGNLTNNGVVSWGGIEIPIGVEYVRVTATGNTGQAVTVDADISEVTAV